MNVKLKDNFWLILGVLLTVVVLFYQDWKMRSPQEDSLKVFPLFETAEVEQVVLAQGSKELKWERRGDSQEWWQISPHEVLADQKVLNELLRTTTVIRSAYELESEPSVQAIQEYGFNDPIFGLTLVLEGDQRFSVRIGSKTPLQDVYYAMSSRWQQIFLIESRELTLWQSSEPSYRYRYLVPEQIKGVIDWTVFQNDEKVWGVDRSGEHFFYTTENSTDKKDVTTLFRRFIFDLKVKEFEDINWYLPSVGEIVAELKYRLSLDGPYHVIQIQKVEGNYWVKNPFGEGYYQVSTLDYLDLVCPQFVEENLKKVLKDKVLLKSHSEEDSKQRQNVSQKVVVEEGQVDESQGTNVELTSEHLRGELV